MAWRLLRTRMPGWEPLRVSLEEPRLGRDLSRLTAHGPEETPLQYDSDLAPYLDELSRPHR